MTKTKEKEGLKELIPIHELKEQRFMESSDGWLKKSETILRRHRKKAMKVVPMKEK